MEMPIDTNKEFYSREFQNDLLRLFEKCDENHTDSCTVTFEYSNVVMEVDFTFRAKKWLKRNPCKECKYYIVTNNTCQSKKCATCGNHSEVTIIDRLFCEPCKVVEDGNENNHYASNS